MNAAGMSGRALRQIPQWLGKRPSENVLVLVYHRVAKPRSDPWSLAVTPERFAEHLEVLRRHAVPLRLQQLSRALAKGATLPGRAVVVTFDDGYADNLHNAKPLLERHDVPATIFLPSGFIGSEDGFWWDELDRLLSTPGKVAQEPSAEHQRENSSVAARRSSTLPEGGVPPSSPLEGLGRCPDTSARSLQIVVGDCCTARQTRSSERYLSELRRWAGLEEDGRPAIVCFPSSRPLPLLTKT